MTRLILDVMGGDFAPMAILEGAKQALPDIKGELILVGDETIIQSTLEKSRFRILKDCLKEGDKASGCKLSVLPASESIEMADSIRAIRSKPKASINIGCQLAAKDWQESRPSAFISAGHSGALMASSLLHMGRLTGIERPAIATKLPTLKSDGCVLLDVGANVECKPENLRDFALMGAHFAKVERTSAFLPKVAILSNGEEKSKGNPLTREAMTLIEKLSAFSPGPEQVAEFVGYAEGKEIFKGTVDVFVTDGFTGNIVLKSLEGLGEAIVTLLKNQFKQNLFTSLGLLFSAPVLAQLKQKLDYAEYGAAPLLGVAGYAFVCHGRSKAKAIKNALLRSQKALQSRYIEHIERAGKYS